MRRTTTLFFVLALGLMGCSETAGNGKPDVFPCTEKGIRGAITRGGGPYTFSCFGPQTVVTEAEIVIDNDVILDGKGNLTVDGDEDHRVFSVPQGVTAELRGLSVRRGRASGEVPEDRSGGGIANSGTLTLTHSTVSGNSGDGGIHNSGTATVTNSTVSGNSGTGITNYLQSGVTLTNSTVSGNSASGIYHWGGTATVTNSTLSGNAASGDGSGIYIYNDEGMVTIAGSLIDGDCRPASVGITSFGHNIESPGNTCSFDQTGDQSGVAEEELNLGPLADNDGPTLRHKPGDGGFDTGSSAAIDKIPEADCQVTEDQRGFPRDSLCDVGAFEVQP